MLQGGALVGDAAQSIGRWWDAHLAPLCAVLLACMDARLDLLQHSIHHGL